MVPMNDLARICLSSLLLTTLISFVSVKFNVIERIRQYRLTNILLTATNITVSVGAIYLTYVSPFVGFVAVFLAIVLLIVQFSRDNSTWMRPIAVNASLFLGALMVLWWFDALPFYEKLMMVYKIS